MLILPQSVSDATLTFIGNGSPWVGILQRAGKPIVSLHCDTSLMPFPLLKDLADSLMVHIVETEPQPFNILNQPFINDVIWYNRDGSIGVPPDALGLLYWDETSLTLWTRNDTVDDPTKRLMLYKLRRRPRYI